MSNSLPALLRELTFGLISSNLHRACLHNLYFFTLSFSVSGREFPSLLQDDPSLLLGNREFIAISTRPAGRRRPNKRAPAIVSLPRSTTEPGATPRPGATLRARAFPDKIASSVRWWPYRPPSTG